MFFRLLPVITSNFLGDKISLLYIYTYISILYLYSKYNSKSTEKSSKKFYFFFFSFRLYISRFNA